MSLIRYDGSRLITESEIDIEFLGKSVLLDCREFPNQSKGFFVASVDTEREQVELLYDIKLGKFSDREDKL